MSESQLRGYMVATTAAFLRRRASERGLPDPSERFSPSLRAALNNIDSAGWYPVAHIGELNRLIASALAENKEDRARTELADCGRFMAEEATNTFMRLIMRLLTPTLFAKKLPDLWRRDCNYGRVELSVDDHSLKLQLHDMAGHDHLAAVMPGYTGFALEKMGKVVKKVNLEGWSMDKPIADGAMIEFVWQE
jgi:hypothetical protein